MPRKPYLSREKTRHGRYVWYFKRGGKRIRLPDTYGTADFNAAYEAALTCRELAPREKPGQPRSGSLKWLVHQYMRSAAWAALAPSTRRARSNILHQVLSDEKNAAAPAAGITKAHIRKGLDKRSAAPNAANNWLKTMAHLFKWAADGDLIKANPCEGVKKIRVKTDGFHAWTIEQVQQYRNHHQTGTRARLAIDLLLFLGLRRGDVIRAGRQHVSGGVLSLKTEKTGMWVHLPILPELQASIDAAPTGDMTFLITERGTGFTSGASFGNWFAKQVKAAGLPDICRAHGLRKAGATMAAEAGASAHEIMAMFGWSDLEMASHYTKAAGRKALAKSGSERLQNKL